MRRIISIVASVIAIVIGVIAILNYFNPGLPKCDQSDTKDNMRQIVAKFMGDKAGGADKVKSALQISDITEVSYDKDAAKRECSAVLDLSIDNKPLIAKEKIGYTITWQNKDEKMFYVQFHEPPK